MKKSKGSNLFSKHKGEFNVHDYQRPEISVEEVQETKQAFDLFDPQGVGYVDPKQLKAALASLGLESTNQPIYHMVCDLVQDGSPDLDFTQFLHLMTARISVKDTRSDLHKIFSLFDTQKKGYLSITNLQRVMREIGDIVDQNQLREMIQKADLDKDGLVSEEEFYTVMTKKVAKS